MFGARYAVRPLVGWCSPGSMDKRV